MHRLLKRQLRKAFSNGIPKNGENFSSEQFNEFINLVEQGYQSMSEQLTIIERSLDLSCTELNSRNNTLSLILDALPDMSLWLDKEGIVRDIRSGNFFPTLIDSNENFIAIDKLSIVVNSPELANFVDNYQNKDGYVAELNLYSNETHYQVKAQITAINHKQWLLVLRDISLVKQLEILQKHRMDQIKKSQKQLQELANAAPTGFVICNPDQEIIMVNQYISNIFQKPKKEFLGKYPTELVANKHRHFLQEQLIDVLKSRNNESNRRIDITLTLPSGSMIQAEVALSTLMFDGQLLVIMSISDISDRKQLENKLRILAETDPLTGAFNRRSFNDHTERAIASCRRMNYPLSLIMLDIDFFKRINDKYGHVAGDEVLIAVVSKIKEVTRKMDILGRVGGEEFAIALPNTSFELANEVAERIRETIENMSVINNKNSIKLTASLGLITLSDCQLEKPLENAINSADQYLYFAKKHGRNMVVDSAGYNTHTN